MTYFLSVPGEFTRTVSDSNYFYALDKDKVVVIRKTDNAIVSSGSYTNLTDVWTADGVPFIYLATSGIGLVKVDKGFLEVSDFSNKINVDKSAPALSSNIVNRIHGNKTSVILGTTSGVNILKGKNIFKSDETDEIDTVFMLESGKIFYAGDFGFVGYLDEITDNWSLDDVDFILDESSVPAITQLPILDIDALETDTNITICLGTSNGVEILDFIKGSNIDTSTTMLLFTED